MATRALSPTAAPKTYAELRSGVEAALLTGQREIERAKVHTYWETGRLIQQHLLLNEDRAAYGAQVIPRLARDLEVSERVLYQCLQFARAYSILHGRAEFTWAHYRALIQIPDEKQRKAVAAEALKNEWTSTQLEARVRELSLLNAPADDTTATSNPSPAAPKLLAAKHGTPGLHLIVDRGDGPVVDLGFKLYRELEQGAASLRSYKVGDIVRLTPEGVRRDPDATKADLFTYAATVRRVVDGDTLVVAIEVAPGVTLEEKLRLRGLDCPEISTPEGKAAKRFTESLVRTAASVILTTTKPDKYDRYLADVFCAPVAAAAETVFLNNALLENGHATRKDSWEFRDWEKELIG